MIRLVQVFAADRKPNLKALSVAIGRNNKNTGAISVYRGFALQRIGYEEPSQQLGMSNKFCQKTSLFLRL